MHPIARLAATAVLVVPALVPAPVGAQETSPPAPGNGRRLSDAQVAGLLEQLATLREQLETGKGGNNAKALELFRQAAASDKAALDLYLACVKADQFDKEERRESEFRDWKNGNDSFHESKEHLAVLRLQLHYLVATIEVARAEKLADAIPAVEDYLDFLFAVEKATLYPKDLDGRNVGRLRQVADQPILSTAFARRYKLDLTLTPPEGWPEGPGNVAQLFDGILMPYYREAGMSAALMGAWDRRIAQAKALAALHQEEEDLRAYNRFVEEHLPRLLWGQARDRFLHQDQFGGAQDLLAVIKENLAHPDAGAWLSEFQAIVEQGGSRPSSNPDPDDGPATDAPATNNRGSGSPTLRDLLEKRDR